MRVIGLDPGLATTGWGVVDGGKSEVNLVAYGVITTPVNMPHTERLQSIHSQVLELIKKYKPDRAAVELLFFYKNTKTATRVGEARGVLMLALAQGGLSVDELTPLQVKQAITSYGRADKQQIQKMVRMMLNLKQVPKPDDAADALAIALTSLQTDKRLS